MFLIHLAFILANLFTGCIGLQASLDPGDVPIHTLLIPHHKPLVRDMLNDRTDKTFNVTTSCRPLKL